MRFDTPSDYSISKYIELTENLLVIYIVRNPVDAIKSEMKRNGATLEFAASQWRESIEIFLKTKKALGDKNVYCIDYESLVASPEDTIAQVLNFLNLEFDEAVMQGFKHTPQYASRKGIETRQQRTVSESDALTFAGELKLFESITTSLKNTG